MQVRRSRGRLGVRFDFAGPTEGPAAADRLVITVNSRQEKATPPETYTFALDEALTGWLLTRRVLDNERSYDVHTSVVDGDGTPSAAERTELKALSPVGRLLSYIRSTLADLRAALRRER